MHDCHKVLFSVSLPSHRIHDSSRGSSEFSLRTVILAWTDEWIPAQLNTIRVLLAHTRMQDPTCFLFVQDCASGNGDSY